MHFLVMLPECWQLNSTEEMLLYAAQPLFKGISYLNNFRAVSKASEEASSLQFHITRLDVALETVLYSPWK